MKKSKIAISVLIIIQMYRIMAYSTGQAALAGTGGVPAPWLFPAFADVFFGVTAPLMVFALWRWKGLGVWVVGVVWLSLSFFDYVDGLVTGITVGPPAPMSNAYLNGWFIAWLSVQVVALILLTRKPMRSHYLQGQ